MADQSSTSPPTAIPLNLKDRAAGWSVRWWNTGIYDVPWFSQNQSETCWSSTSWHHHGCHDALNSEISTTSRKLLPFSMPEVKFPESSGAQQSLGAQMGLGQKPWNPLLFTRNSWDLLMFIPPMWYCTFWPIAKWATPPPYFWQFGTWTWEQSFTIVPSRTHCRRNPAEKQRRQHKPPSHRVSQVFPPATPPFCGAADYFIFQHYFHAMFEQFELKKLDMEWTCTILHFNPKTRAFNGHRIIPCSTGLSNIPWNGCFTHHPETVLSSSRWCFGDADVVQFEIQQPGAPSYWKCHWSVDSCELTISTRIIHGTW